MKKPNFFIVGAPKCGTTALYTYLCTHPGIFFARIKEPHFFAADFPKYRRFSSLKKYLALFDKSESKHIAVGEASVFYLDSQVAIANLFAFNPDSKVIVMLRNPVEMLPSLHSQLVYGFRETEKDFQRAWRLQETRALGRHLPPHCLAPEHLQYGRVAKFGEQLQRLLEIIPRRQVKVILLEDLIESPRTVYEDVLAFLGVPLDARTTFEKVNENKVHSFPLFTRLLVRPPFPLNFMKSGLKKALGLEQVRIWKYLSHLDASKTARSALPGPFRRELIAYFEQDVQKLQTLLERDLRHWITWDAPSRVA